MTTVDQLDSPVEHLTADQLATARQIAEYMHHQLRPIGWDYLPYKAGIVNTRTGARVYRDTNPTGSATLTAVTRYDQPRENAVAIVGVRTVDQALAHLCAAGVLPESMSPAYRAGCQVRADEIAARDEQIARLEKDKQRLEELLRTGDDRYRGLLARQLDDQAVIHPSARIGYGLTDKAAQVLDVAVEVAA